MSITATSPVGRLVQGSVHEAETKDQKGNLLTFKSGPNAGQPQKKWFFAIAIPKTDPEFQALHQLMQQEARAGFPHFFNPQGQCLRQDFAWKLTDGDSQTPNQNLKRPCDQEGFPGHWVLKFSTTLKPPRCFDTANTEIAGETIKLGYWIRVGLSIGANGDSSKPGLYINPNLVQLVGYGQEISKGPSAAEAFAKPVALPPGASATPVAPVGALPGIAPPPANPPAAAYTAPQPQAVPQMPVIPAHDFVQPALPVATPPAPPVAYAPPPPPPPPVAAVEANYLYNGQVYAESALRNGGFTDAHLAGLQRV